MSFRAVTWAFDVVKGLGANEKLLLLALAEFANDADETWRSSDDLAARVECSSRSLKTHLAALEERGLVERTPRYAWCDDAIGPCASRARHKHRSGTMYKLRLDRSVALPLPSKKSDGTAMSSEVATESQLESRRIVSVASRSKTPTGATFAPVEKVAESSGNPHRCNFCTCGDEGGSIGANLGIPQVQRVAPVLREEPPINPPTNQPNPVAHQPELGLVGGDDPGPVSAPDGASPGVASVEDRLLVVACLPPVMHGLDAAGVLDVAALLRERVDAGWSEAEILRVMDQPLPPQVERMASLVAYRLRRNVDPGMPPPKPQQAPRATAMERVEPPHEQAWDQYVWEPAFFECGGRDNLDPSGIINATKGAVAVLSARGLRAFSWPGFWAEAVQARSDLDPEDPAAWPALVEVARDLALARLEEAS